MTNKRAFTLLELLIAAAIMSVLAVLGTSAYKHSISETRIQDGKNRLRVVAGAMQRYMMDHPDVTYDGSSHLTFVSGEDVQTCPRLQNFTAAALVQCDYLENRQWSTGQIKIVTCGGVAAGELCKDSTVSNPLACMTGISNRLDAKYQQANNYVFCISEAAEG